MSASFERIDYSLRPAKHAERRMLCDVFRRLRPFGRVEDYVYVGFGSVWFADFSLFHRALGIRDMVSIEQQVDAKLRIEDNKPFRIPVDYRKSTAVLPELDWTRKQFLWMDYDSTLDADMLQDVRTVARRATSGTALSVSVQCMRAPQIADAQHDKAIGALSALERFIALFGRDRVPPDTTEEDLHGWPYALLSREMILQEIQAELAARNSIGPDEFYFKSICDFEYVDGAKMTTVVGVFWEKNQSGLLEDCHFEALDFLPNPPGVVRINVPKLTVREFRRLESQMPLNQGANLNLGSIPAKEAAQFQEMYRFLPSFAVIEG